MLLMLVKWQTASAARQMKTLTLSFRASLPSEMAAPPMMGTTAHWTPRSAAQAQ